MRRRSGQAQMLLGYVAPVNRTTGAGHLHTMRSRRVLTSSHSALLVGRRCYGRQEERRGQAVPAGPQVTLRLLRTPPPPPTTLRCQAGSTSHPHILPQFGLVFYRQHALLFKFNTKRQVALLAPHQQYAPPQMVLVFHRQRAPL